MKSVAHAKSQPAPKPEYNFVFVIKGQLTSEEAAELLQQLVDLVGPDRVYSSMGTLNPD